MYKKKVFYLTLGTLLGISFLFLLLSLSGTLSSIAFLHTIFAPLQKGLFFSSQRITASRESSLQKENESLTQQVVQYKNLEKDNEALRDQFQTASIPTKHLLPAHIIAEPGFIPGQTAVEDFTLDQGSRDGIKNGMAVVYKNTLLGKVVETTSHISHVLRISNTAISFAAKTVNGNALGVMKGQGGGEMILDDVVLNQTLKTGDIVETSGDVDMHGLGYPPNLVVGKIISVQKDPSALFQRANVESLVDITNVSTVFVMTQQ